MKTLIVNADDFGFTPGVNEGILRAFREGILTSTTIMANGPAFDDAVSHTRDCPEIDVGCHLVLVGGKSVAPPGEIPSLAKRDGDLPKSLFELTCRLWSGMVQEADIEREFHAQVERVIAAGITPSHLDTHKHTHAHPAVMNALFRIAKEFKILRVRMPFERGAMRGTPSSPSGGGSITQRMLASAAGMAAPAFRRGLREYNLRSPQHFFGVALTGHLKSPALKHLIETLPEGTSEIVCHPGVCDAELEQSDTRLKKQREVELEALTDPAILGAVREQQVHLAPYRELN
ncbi:MAG TPA: ChbG/HpnK family deacetylase [Candidatus Acidoferrales bacterium]|nr:ChbG/HpnK family deacetylase [Candidatus Acidoferrales bacterium]